MLLLLLPVAAFGFRLQGSPPLGAVRVQPRAALPLRALPQMVASNDEHVRDAQHAVDSIKKIAKFLDLPELVEGGIELAQELLSTGRDLGLTSPLSAFQEFDAELDLLQKPLTGKKLIRKKAQTWANVTSPSQDDREQIDAAYEWSHELFPNIHISTPFAARTGRCRPSRSATHAFGPAIAQGRAVSIQRFASTGTRSLTLWGSTTRS